MKAAAQPELVKAADCRLASCDVCGRVSRVPPECCPRCGSALHLRKPDSIRRTMAMLAAATALCLPAHLLPMLTIVELGRVSPNTIIGGMLTFWESGDYPIALVIFAASILIPVIKIATLLWLCAAASGWSHPSPAALVRVHGITELLGRWSMVDIFVVGILVSLLQLGNYMMVLPGPGALAFAGVVVFTMLAAMAFDPRLLWDRVDATSNAARLRTRESSPD
jgi:paraquat-inducible protein A